MATLILVAAGAALGVGPIIGAAAALAGQFIDHSLFSSSGSREGRRLTDLRVQTSTYGTPIPRLYGAMRVAGTVIWSTDLKETSQHSGGGKGSPSVTSYSYSASFAVALSSRPVTSVGRIWADGNLLRGAAGDFKTGLGSFRLAPGTGDQPVDPLMAAAIGLGQCPAHRDIAYALFENLDLSDFGNRIPTLTFELFCEAGPVRVEAIMRDISRGLIADDVLLADATVDGFAAFGANMTEALSPLAQSFGLSLATREDGLHLVSGETAVSAGALLVASDIARSANGRSAPVRRIWRDPAGKVPVRLSLRYFDPSRDYQAGLQTAMRPGAGRTEETLDLPATMDAGSARSRADSRLRASWTGRDRIEVKCGWSALHLQPGTVVSLDDQPGLWTIVTANWEDGLVQIELRRIASGTLVALSASAGTAVLQPDLAAGVSRIDAIELPSMGDAAASGPIVMVAGAGASAGWRGAALYVRDPVTDALDPVGRTAARATLGDVAAPPNSSSSPHLVDMGSALVVTLLSDAMALSGASDLRLAQGANLCAVGDELIQFGLAEPLGQRVFRLTRLWRGRRGTEDKIASHGAAEAFILLDQNQLFALPAERLHVGETIHVSAIGIGDLSPVEDAVAITGLAHLPLAPVRLGASAQSGGWRLDWVRRSRTGWRWGDGSDVPLAEESERYRLDWTGAAGPFRSAEVTGLASLLYDSAMVAADLAAGHAGPVTIYVRQIGTFGAGPPAALSLVL